MTDIAATGQDYTLDPELMEPCRPIIEPQPEAFRSAGAVSPEVAVPADAGAQTWLLALLAEPLLRVSGAVVLGGGPRGGAADAGAPGMTAVVARHPRRVRPPRLG